MQSAMQEVLQLIHFCAFVDLETVRKKIVKNYDKNYVAS